MGGGQLEIKNVHKGSLGGSNEKMLRNTGV